MPVPVATVAPQSLHRMKLTTPVGSPPLDTPVGATWPKPDPWAKTPVARPRVGGGDAAVVVGAGAVVEVVDGGVVAGGPAGAVGAAPWPAADGQAPRAREAAAVRASSGRRDMTPLR